MQRQRLYHTVLLSLLAAMSVSIGACSRADQSTPESTIAAAREAVEQGRAEQLATFIYADNQDMRRLLNRMGRFLGSVQRLGDALQAKFPEETGALKAQAEAAAKEGKSTSLMAQVTKQMAGGRRRNVKPEDAEKMRAEFDAAIQRLFADPYAFLRESESRLTIAPVNDNTVALLWDQQPIMPPVGMVMKRADDGKWYFVLPTNLPGLSSVMPRTTEEYQIWGSLIRTFDNVVIDLTKDVEAGRVASLESVAREAGEKTFIPAAMVFVAIGRASEIRRDEAKAAKAAAQPAPAPQEAAPQPVPPSADRPTTDGK
jgi:hypothetical protein